MDFICGYQISPKALVFSSSKSISLYVWIFFFICNLYISDTDGGRDLPYLSSQMWKILSSDLDDLNHVIS